jgi:AcrR family transcriptional regulator
MVRRVPESRFKDLLDCATRVFILQGYRRTQMSDVAEALGVAKGTLYLYVESKEALFAAVLLYADGEVPAASLLDLPLATPAPGELTKVLSERLASVVIPASLGEALARKRVTDVRTELESIVRDLYQLSTRHRTATKLIDRCGRDHPELAKIFYEGGRYTQLEQIAEYIESRVQKGKLRAVPNTSLAARFVIEAIATWAVHIHWDPSPQVIDPEEAEETVVQLVVSGLLP